jgi:hypothetical protein
LILCALLVAEVLPALSMRHRRSGL